MTRHALHSGTRRPRSQSRARRGPARPRHGGDRRRRRRRLSATAGRQPGGAAGDSPHPCAPRTFLPSRLRGGPGARGGTCGVPGRGPPPPGAAGSSPPHLPGRAAAPALRVGGGASAARPPGPAAGAPVEVVAPGGQGETGA